MFRYFIEIFKNSESFRFEVFHTRDPKFQSQDLTKYSEFINHNNVRFINDRTNVITDDIIASMALYYTIYKCIIIY